jgi:hypothetical protein
MTKPFTTPPPLGDDIEARAHQIAKRLRARRRASAVGAAALVLLLLGGAAAAASGGNHRDAKVHVAGPPDAPSRSSSSTLPGTNVTTHSGAHPSSTSAPRRSTPGETSSTTSRSGTVEPGTAPDVTSAPGIDPTAPPGTVTTTTVWDPANVCVPGPQGTTITLTPTIQAQQVATGKWHISGTMTIVNTSAYAYYTVGYLYITGTTVPGGTDEGWVGWSGPETVLVGSGFSVGGLVGVPAGQTVTVPLDQTLHTDGDANAYATGTTAPTTIHQGQNYGTFDRFVNGCDNTPSIIDNFPIGGSPPG